MVEFRDVIFVYDSDMMNFERYFDLSTGCHYFTERQLLV